MKRTVEVVLSIIGAFVYMLGTFFGVFFRMIDGNDEILENFVADNPELTQQDLEVMETMQNSLGLIGTVLIVGSTIAVIAGVVAMIFFRGNKRPKAASIILLVVGGITTLVTFGGAIFAGIFYIIAGIVGLVRKPKQEIDVEQYG